MPKETIKKPVKKNKGKKEKKVNESTLCNIHWRSITYARRETGCMHQSLTATELMEFFIALFYSGFTNGTIDPERHEVFSSHFPLF